MSSRALLAVLTLVVLAVLSWQLRWVLLVFFGAVVLSVALDVLIQKLRKKIPIPRAMALGLVLIFLLICGACIFQLLVPELIAQISELGRILPDVIAKLKSIISNQPRLEGLQQSIPDQFSWEKIQPVGSKLLGFAGGAANTLLQLVLISLLAILLALDPNSHRKIVIASTPRPFRHHMSNVLDDCRAALGGWLTGMTISATTVFMLTWAGLSLLKIPLALLSALICGLLTFVPTIGPTTASLLPIGIALIKSPTLMVEVLILRLAIQNLEAFLLTPVLLRKSVNLLPTVALMAQLSLGALLGIPGVLLALPLSVVIQVGMQKIIIKEIMDKWI